MTFLLLACLAHVTADFLLQTPGIIRGRAEGKFRPCLLHAAWVAATLFLALHYYGPGLAALTAAGIALTHLLLDWGKDLFSRGRGPGPRLALFLADQVLHLGVLFAVWQRLDPQPNARVAAFYQGLLSPRAQAALASLAPAKPPGADQILVTLISFIAVMFGGAILIRMFLDALRVAPPEGEAKPAASQMLAGKYIGVLERGLILILIMVDALASVGFVMAAKSFARFKDLDDRNFAEYYLVGTLASIMLAVAAGLGLRGLLARL